MKVMLDLETLGASPGSVICAIGGVVFGHGKIAAEFYRRVDPEDCVRRGLRIEVATVLWWLKQADAARAELCLPGEPLLPVLTDFHTWVGDPSAVEIYGNGANFDLPILTAAYRACGLPIPWKYYNERCYRTIKSLYPSVEAPKNGHNALEDARNQAMHLMRLQENLDSPCAKPAAA